VGLLPKHRRKYQDTLIEQSFMDIFSYKKLTKIKKLNLKVEQELKYSLVLQKVRKQGMRILRQVKAK